MLQARMQFKVILYSTLFGLFALLNACSNSGQLEGFLSADPNLKSPTETTNVSNRENLERDSNNNTDRDIQLTKLPKEKSASEVDSSIETNNDLELKTEQSVTDLPKNLPFYPQAELESIASISNREYGVSEWETTDSIDTIVSYYQKKWQDNDWQIIEPFRLDPNTNRQTAIVSQDNLDFTIFLTPSGRETTDLKIMYQTADSQIASIDDTEETAISNKNNLEENTEGNNFIEEIENDTTTERTNELDTQVDLDSVTDEAEIPEELRQYVRDVVALDIATPIENGENKDFQPDEPITRRDYAKWLVTANNKYYGSSSGNRIRLAGKSSNPAFKDIGVNDPDFSEIQGLAEAGLIPSPLTNNSEELLFQPDAPLTREDLITWKVPLDTRQALPKADVKAIQEAWGFQDANKVDPLALPALFADYQNSDRSNVKRIFGYTTLLQPKKPVTRAEAAASLWYFGYQGDGITAPEALNLAR